MKRAAKSLIDLWRISTSNYRSLPDFLVIGAQKGGSTSLYDYLIQHPEIYSATTKEVHFFSNLYGKGDAWYRAQFHWQKNGVITGEATPYYLFHPLAAPRIARLIPHVKIIVVLRDPVDRAISHYYHAVRHGFEHLSICDAIERSIVEFSQDEKTVMEGSYSFNHQERSYGPRGLYAEQLSRYTKLFSSSQLLIIRSEDLFTAPAKMLKRLFRFLDVVSEFTPADLTPKNTRTDTKIEPQEREARARLESYFKEPNKRLAETYGVNFGTAK